jgi:hypothetical protein
MTEGCGGPLATRRFPFHGALARTWTDALQYREPEKEAAPWSEAS